MDNFEVRPNVSAQYRYFDRSYRAELTLFLLFGPALVVLWSIFAWYFHSSGRLPLPIMKLAIYVSITYLFVRIFYRNYRSIAGARSVVMDGDMIVKRSAGVARGINCADIKGVRRVNFPLIRRWVVLETSAGSKGFLLPVCVRNGHRMVDRLFMELQERGVRFTGAAELRDTLYSAARRCNTLQKLRTVQMDGMFRVATAAALFYAAVVLMFWELDLLTALWWGVLSMLLQIVAYLVVESLHVKKLLRGKGKTVVDDSFKGYYTLAGISAMLAAMAAGVFMKDWQVLHSWFWRFWV